MNKNVFEYTNYKTFVIDWVEGHPKGPRGQYRSLAKVLRTSTTMISQVFKGDKHLSHELAYELAQHMGLSEAETEYFLLLLQRQKCGSHKLESFYTKRLQAMKTESLKLVNRLGQDRKLSEATKARFYSSWQYSAIRNLTAIENFQHVAAIAEHLRMPLVDVQKVVRFLVDNELCARAGEKIVVGPQKTHEAHDSPFVHKHHQNWRMLGFQKFDQDADNNLFYTGPMSLSSSVAQKIRQELPRFIEQIHRWVLPSKSEVSRCLNIDWFEY